jgi:hypothetical protein
MAGIWDLIKGLSASDVALAGLGTAAYTTQQQALEDFAKRAQQTTGRLTQEAQQA